MTASTGALRVAGELHGGYAIELAGGPGGAWAACGTGVAHLWSAVDADPVVAELPGYVAGAPVFVDGGLLVGTWTVPLDGAAPAQLVADDDWLTAALDPVDDQEPPADLFSATTVQWSPDGRWFVAVTAYRASRRPDDDRRWSGQRGQVLVVDRGGKVLSTLADEAVRVAAGRDAVAVATGDSLRWWDAGGWAEHTADGWPAGACQALVADATGRWFAGAFSTGAVAVADTRSGEVRSWTGHEGQVRCIAVDERADVVASGGEDGELRIWPVTGSAKDADIAAAPHATFAGAVQGVAFGEGGGELLVAHRGTNAALTVVQRTS